MSMWLAVFLRITLKFAKKLEDTTTPAIELNFSCPNVAAGCMSFGADPANIEVNYARYRDLTDKEIWVKLTEYH